METKLLPLTSHCALDVGANVAHTFCPAERAASGVNPSGPGYHGGVVGSRWNLTEQLLQRTWGNRARPSGTEVPREKATPMKRPFLWKESSTAASVEKDCHTVEIRKKRGPLTLPKLDLFVTSKTEKDSKKSVTHSVTANDVPHWEGFSKLFLRPTWHFFTAPIVRKREFIFTWYETDRKPEGQRSKQIILSRCLCSNKYPGKKVKQPNHEPNPYPAAESCWPLTSLLSGHEDTCLLVPPAV